MRITYRTALEVITHEAIVRQAYRDSVGVWTWSVGLTSATTHNVERYIGKPQSLEYCLKIFVWALDRYAAEVRKAFDGFPLDEAEFAAALSFHWNTGAISRASWVKLMKAGAPKHEIRASFLRYNKPPEIASRRMKEADLLLDGKWSQNGYATEYTRVSASGRIDWGSARRVNVQDALRAALGQTVKRPPDKPPAPVTPTGWGAIIAAIAAALAALWGLLT